MNKIYKDMLPNWYNDDCDKYDLISRKGKLNEEQPVLHKKLKNESVFCFANAYPKYESKSSG